MVRNAVNGSVDLCVDERGGEGEVELRNIFGTASDGSETNAEQLLCAEQALSK